MIVPGPAEIIRASQKDNSFIRTLREDVNGLVELFLGQTALRKWRESPTSLFIPTALYYALTNLSGSQTLGEEYTGVLQVQVGKNGLKIPSKKALVLMILFTATGKPLLEYILKLVGGHLAKGREAEEAGRAGRRLELLTLEAVTPEELVELDEAFSWIAMGQEIVDIFQHYLPFLNQLHLAVFFLRGTFYNVSKRLTGIQYVLVRNYFANQDAQARLHLKYLMWMSVLNSIVTAITDSFKYVQGKRKTPRREVPQPTYLYPRPRKSLDEEQTDFVMVGPPDEKVTEAGTEREEQTKQCSLCMEARRDTSLCPCGHLFCWSCILDWLRSKEECPVCRAPVQPSRIVPLRNMT